MKKKFLLGATTVLVATAAYMGVDAHSRSSQTSTLQLANIEALSDNSETETNTSSTATDWATHLSTS